MRISLLAFVVVLSLMALTSAAGEKNVLGSELQVCSTQPLTGYFRDGYCLTGPSDTGRHVVCARVTDEFLSYTRAQGNDLSTPSPAYNFPGLRDGDQWCLCASRWAEAKAAGVAPPVDLGATHEAALKYVQREALESARLLPPEEGAGAGEGDAASFDEDSSDEAAIDGGELASFAFDDTDFYFA
eukprot:tig00021135_g18935.t1